MWILVDDFFLAGKIKRKSEDRLVFGLPLYYFPRKVSFRLPIFFEIIAPIFLTAKQKTHNFFTDIQGLSTELSTGSG